MNTIWIITIAYGAGTWTGVLFYEWYLRRLHNTQAYIKRVQQGARKRKVTGR